MANLLPFLLVGGGIVYMTVGGKKKKAPFLWISDDCTEAKIMGLTPEQVVEKSGDERLSNKFRTAIQSWSRETLDLEGWFQNRPNLKPEDYDDFAMEIAIWRYPHCKISEDMEFNSMPFKIYMLVFAAVIAYAIENKILTTQQVVDMLKDGIISSLGPLIPDGVSAIRQIPPEIQMVL